MEPVTSSDMTPNSRSSEDRFSVQLGTEHVIDEIGSSGSSRICYGTVPWLFYPTIFLAILLISLVFATRNHSLLIASCSVSSDAAGQPVFEILAFSSMRFSTVFNGTVLGRSNSSIVGSSFDSYAAAEEFAWNISLSSNFCRAAKFVPPQAFPLKVSWQDFDVATFSSDLPLNLWWIGVALSTVYFLVYFGMILKKASQPKPSPFLLSIVFAMRLIELGANLLDSYLGLVIGIFIVVEARQFRTSIDVLLALVPFCWGLQYCDSKFSSSSCFRNT